MTVMASGWTVALCLTVGVAWSAPAAAQAPFAGPTPAPEVHRAVDFSKPGTPIYLDNERPVTLDALAVIPYGHYRARVLRPDHGQGWMELFPRTGIVVGDGFGAPCVERSKILKAVFDSATAEEALRRRAEFLAGAPNTPCPTLERVFADAFKSLTPMLAYGVNPVAGLDLKLTVERLGEDGKVIQTLEWPLLPPPAARVATETEWIVGEVSARMAALAREGGALSVVSRAGSATMFEVKGAGKDDLLVDVKAGPWDARRYVSVARALGARPGHASDRVFSNDMLAALTTPSLGTLLAVNKELGLALRADRLNPTTHEAAALLLVTIAMQSAPSGLEDIRPLLNRATAHLALAAGVREAGFGVEGEVASVGLDVLMGRQAPAARRLRAIAGRLTSSAARIWSRALMMRATGDWRIYRPGQSGSFLEQLEYARALNRSWSGERAAEVVRGEVPFPESPVWSRAIVREQASVELGQEFVAPRMAAELEMAATIAESYGDEDVSHWMSTAGAGPWFAPVSPRTWAGVTEGALGDAALKLQRFLEGLPPSSANAEVIGQLSQDFPRSLVMKVLAANLPGVPDSSRCDEIAAGLKAEPFGMSARAYAMGAQGCGFMERRFPSLGARLTPWTPEGTLFDFSNRLELMPLMERISKSDWRSLRQLTFYEPAILLFTVGSEQRDLESRDYRSFQQEKNYSLAMLADWRYVGSTRGDIKESLEPGRLACKLDAAECFHLVEILRAEGLADEAFAIAMRAVGNGPISVGLSAEVSWVIDENVRRGNLAAAGSIANRAAATGSYVGLLVRARLTERQGKMEEARTQYAALDDEYHSDQAAWFAIRQLARDPGRPKAEVMSALAALGQPEEVMMGAGVPPVAGVAPSEGWLAELGVARRAQGLKLGFLPGDAIVKVNGISITNAKQFWVALSLTTDEVVEFEVVGPQRQGPVILRGPFYRSPYSRIGS